MRLYGKNPVIERLRANPKSIRKITLQRGLSEATIIGKKARQWGIPVRVVEKSKILKMTRNSNAQGVIIDIDDPEYVAYDELLEYALKKKRVLVFLDELNDPQNLGAIIRSLGCLGHFSLVLPTHKSVKITEAVLRVASGGENYVQFGIVSNLNKAIRQAKDEGFHIAGTVVEGGEPLDAVDLPFPLGVVIGSEQKGIRDVTKKVLDVRISIPMHVNTVTFNAAAAASIICYEITKQRRQKK
ncbi:MAG: RNA methyltransferase [Candidatus Omnitrophica bacterium]|nr:RNA methyltransferase [Candidatus Omnitrophota bacterium]